MESELEEKKAGTISIGIIIMLSIVALALGYLIYQNHQLQNATPASGTEST